MDASEPASPETEPTWQVETGWFARLRAWLFGYDIFISYKREDGLSYAVALEDRLHDLDYACFRDRTEIPPSGNFRKIIERALRRSRLLVVIGSPVATDPVRAEWVRREIETYQQYRSHIIVVNIDGAVDAETWPGISEKVWINETATALEQGKPEENIVHGITQSIRFKKRNRLARWTVTSAVSAIAMLALAAIGFLARSEYISSTLAMAAESELIRIQRPARLYQSAELAARAASRYRSFATHSALQNALRIMPPLLADIEIPCGPKYTARSPDNRFLAVGESWKLCIVDLDKRELVESYDYYSLPATDSFDSISGIRFSPDGMQLTVSMNIIPRGSRFRSYETDSWKESGNIALNVNVTTFEYTPNSQYLLVGTEDGQVVYYRAHDPAPSNRPARILSTHSGKIERLLVDPSRDRLLVSGKNALEAWSLSTLNDPVRTWHRPMGTASIPFSVQLPMLIDQRRGYLIAAYDDVIEIRESDSFELRQTIPMTDVDALFLADDASLIAHSKDGYFKTWKPPRPPLPVSPGTVLQPYVNPVTPLITGDLPTGDTLAATPDGDTLIAFHRQPASTESWGSLMSVSSGREVGRVFHKARIWQYFQDSTGTSAITIGADNHIRFWGDLRGLYKETRHIEDVEMATISGNEEQAAFSTQPLLPFWSDIEIWSINELKPVASHRFKGSTLAIGFTGPQSLLVAHSNKLYSWNPTSPNKGSLTELATFPELGLGCQRAATFSSDADRFVVTAGRGEFWTYTGGSFSKLELAARNRQCPSSVQLSPSGRLLAVAYPSQVVVHDLASSSILFEIPTRYLSRSIAFDDADQLVAIAASDKPGSDYLNPEGSIRVWSIPGKRELIDHNLDAQSSLFNDICLNDSGDKLAVTSDGLLTIWNLVQGSNPAMSLRTSIELATGAIPYCRFSNDSNTVYVVTSHGMEKYSIDLDEMVSDMEHRLGPLLEQDSE